MTTPEKVLALAMLLQKKYPNTKFEIAISDIDAQEINSTVYDSGIPYNIVPYNIPMGILYAVKKTNLKTCVYKYSFIEQFRIPMINDSDTILDYEICIEVCLEEVHTINLCIGGKISARKEAEEFCKDCVYPLSYRIVSQSEALKYYIEHILQGR